MCPEQVVHAFWSFTLTTVLYMTTDHMDFWGLFQNENKHNHIN